MVALLNDRSGVASTPAAAFQVRAHGLHDLSVVAGLDLGISVQAGEGIRQLPDLVAIRVDSEGDVLFVFRFGSNAGDEAADACPHRGVNHATRVARGLPGGALDRCCSCRIR